MSIERGRVNLTAEEMVAETLPMFDALEELLARVHRGILTTGGCGCLTMRYAGMPDTEMLAYIRAADEALVRVSELAEKARAALADMGQAHV
jgi:hypothetical protein